MAVLKVGESRAGAAAAAAHTGAVAGDQRASSARWSRRRARPGSAIRTSCWRPRECSPSRGRGRGREPAGLAILTCSGGDSGIAADLAEQEGLELPPLADETQAELAELLPDAATPGNPLDYTSMIWGESELLASIVEAVGADPAIDQLLLLYDQPAGLRPEHEDQWRAVRTGLADGAERCDAAALIASTLPDLLDDDAARELAARGIPAVAGLDHRAGLRPGAAEAGRATRPGCGRSPRRPRERAHRSERSRRRLAGGGGAKRLLRDGGLPVPEGSSSSSATRTAASPRRASSAGRSR